MLLQRLNRLFLFLRGEVGVDVHGHGWVGVTEEILGSLHIHAGIVEHSGIGMAKLVSSEPVHSDNLGMAPASVPSAGLDVQMVVHIGIPGGGPGRIGHHTAACRRTNIQGSVSPCLPEDGNELGRERHDPIARRRLGPLDLRLVLPESGGLGAKFGSILSTFFRDQRTSFLPV